MLGATGKLRKIKSLFLPRGGIYITCAILVYHNDIEYKHTFMLSLKIINTERLYCYERWCKHVKKTQLIQWWYKLRIITDEGNLMSACQIQFERTNNSHWAMGAHQWTSYDNIWHWYTHCHDDVIKWKLFSALLAICAGNSPVTGEFPPQRPVTRSFYVFFDLRLNLRLSKQPWGWWFETP